MVWRVPTRSLVNSLVRDPSPGKKPPRRPVTTTSATGTFANPWEQWSFRASRRNVSVRAVPDTFRRDARKLHCSQGLAKVPVADVVVTGRRGGFFPGDGSRTREFTSDLVGTRQTMGRAEDSTYSAGKIRFHFSRWRAALESAGVALRKFFTHATARLLPELRPESVRAR